MKIDKFGFVLGSTISSFALILNIVTLPNQEGVIPFLIWLGIMIVGFCVISSSFKD